MPNYRRNYAGSLFFFTLVTHGRRLIFNDHGARSLLRKAIERTRQDRPWDTEGIVLLPDHLHVLWHMQSGDTDYSGRIAAVKNRFTRAFLRSGGKEGCASAGQRRHRRRGVWQPRFWEHTIRDAKDFRLHLDYIHVNPVKHGLADRPVDWPWSSFHRYVKTGVYGPDWRGRAELPDSVEYFWPE